MMKSCSLFLTRVKSLQMTAFIVCPQPLGTLLYVVRPLVAVLGNRTPLNSLEL